jgi:hypothetical protein
LKCLLDVARHILLQHGNHITSRVFVR